jgi:NAD(P)-dependent dehydrogenase (short-subunit alcohol dehydrogenase family)
VLALDRHGRVVRDTGSIQQLNPGGGTFGPDGRYYIGLRSARTIMALSATLDGAGECILPPGIVPFPRGFAFSGDGALFLSSGIGPNGEGDNTIVAFARGQKLQPAGFYCASKFALEALAEAYSYELASQGIESVIVEPGAYETPVFGNTVTAADQARTTTYSAVKEIPAKVNAALSSGAGNAQEVADAVLRIIETPAGDKQLRYFVSPRNFGVDEINALSKQVQANVLEAFGLAADIKFLKGKAVGSV